MGMVDAVFGQVKNALAPASVQILTQQLLVRDILRRGNMVLHSGSSPFEEAHLPSAGITAQAIYSGTESIAMTSTNGLVQTKVTPHMFAANVVLSERELLSVQERTASGGGDVFIGSASNLIKLKTDAAVHGLVEDLVNWFLVGANVATDHPFKAGTTATYADILTLNGAYSGGSLTGNTNGLLDFVAPASQTDRVKDLVKSVSNHHYNQFKAATNWDTDGMSAIRQIRARCATHNRALVSPGSFPDVGIADPITFANILDSSKANVRVADANDNGEVTNEGLITTDLGGLKVHYSSMLGSTALDAATSASGLIYLLNTNYLHWITTLKEDAIPGAESSSADPILKMFNVRKPTDSVATGTRYIVVPLTGFGNFNLSQLPAHGAVTNTAA